jgi:hypothetical protein
MPEAMTADQKATETSSEVGATWWMCGLGAKAAWAMDAQAGMSEGVAGRRMRAILEGDWGGWLGLFIG